jgi:iron complex transport system substrate-binding protein
MNTGKLFTVLAVGLVLAGSAAAGQSRIIKDDLGTDFRLLDSKPTRIVSLAPNITEILFALGLGDRVVGVTRFCDFPEAALGIRRVGGLVDPNIEIIRSLDPDLVIAFRGNPLRVLGRLRELGLRVFVLDSPEDIDALAPLIHKIGVVTAADGAAARLSESIRARTGRVARLMEGVLRKPRVFVILYGRGLWTCGSESYLDDLLRQAGAVNVAGRVPRKWFLYTRERLVRDNPDSIVILAGSEGDFVRAERLILEETSYRRIPAVETGSIFRLEESAASRFGPRLVDVLETLARLLHPERFGEGR